MTGILNALFASLAGPQNVTVIQSFTATGEWVCPTGVTEVEWLIVAGGGGGGRGNSGGGGGGGAGGLELVQDYLLPQELHTQLQLVLVELVVILLLLAHQ
jgi:hypothetical protein